jgi:hypothetical protein
VSWLSPGRAEYLEKSLDVNHQFFRQTPDLLTQYTTPQLNSWDPFCIHKQLDYHRTSHSYSIRVALIKHFGETKQGNFKIAISKEDTLRGGKLPDNLLNYFSFVYSSETQPHTGSAYDLLINKHEYTKPVLLRLQIIILAQRILHRYSFSQLVPRVVAPAINYSSSLPTWIQEPTVLDIKTGADSNSG